MCHSAKNLSQTFTLNPNIVWTVVDGEALLLDVTSGLHFSLNGVATEIWVNLGEGKPLAEIIETISQTYGIEQAATQEDVQALMGELCAENLCVAVSEPE